MQKTIVKLTPRGNSLAVTIPKDMLDQLGLVQGDELSLLARDDGVMEISRVDPGEDALNDAFDWSLGRYAKTYRDLAK